MNDVKVSSTDLPVRQSPGVPAEKAGQQARAVSEVAVQEARVKETENATEDARELVASVEEAVANLNEYVQTIQRDLQFRLDDTSGKTVITVYDRQTEEVVRQIPDDVALRLARNLQQEEPINLFNTKV